MSTTDCPLHHGPRQQRCPAMATPAATMCPALDPNTIYIAHDRFVCGTTRCAGSTAVATGRDIDGHKLRPVDERDIAEWATYDLGPLTCECGRVTAEAQR